MITIDADARDKMQEELDILYKEQQKQEKIKKEKEKEAKERAKEKAKKEKEEKEKQKRAKHKALKKKQFKDKTDKEANLKKVCTKCQTIKTLKNSFYRVHSEHFTDGFGPICKTCCNAIDPYDYQGILGVLQLMDKPMIDSVYYSCLKKYSITKSVFGNYMRQLSGLNQYTNLRFRHSIITDQALREKVSHKLGVKFTEPEEELKRSQIVNLPNQPESAADLREDETMTHSKKIIKLNDEIRHKWKGYSDEEVLELEKFYEEMITTHEINTPQHLEILKTICLLNLKMRTCLDNNDPVSFAKYHTQYTKSLEMSGFRPIDKTAADDSKGVRTFSQIFKEVEKRGFIKPDSRTLIDQDLLDATILYIANYTRKLLGIKKLERAPQDTPKTIDFEGFDYEPPEGGK